MAPFSLPSCPVDLPISAYNCANPYPNCTTPFGFDFFVLFAISEYIATCPTDWRIHTHDAHTGLLSQAACEQIVGSDGFTYYSGADIWARLTTWKFPLLQLVAIFPRPPLSLASEALVIVGLLGNPIGTVRNLLLKLGGCQSRAEFWRGRVREQLQDLFHATDDGARRAEEDGAWKALALITNTYDEWGRESGDDIRDFLMLHLTSPVNDSNLLFLAACRKTAASLAADRTTKFLPITVAQAFFIGTIAIAFGRTPALSAGPSPSTYINIEAHSIAFSSLYFWIIPVVILGSVIGVSQTEYAVPRILREQFADALRVQFPGRGKDMEPPNSFLSDIWGQSDPATGVRERSGGIYTQQPQHLMAVLAKEAEESSAPTGRSKALEKFLKWFLRPGSSALPLTIVLSCLFGGLLISALVPPIGFGARDIVELLIVLVWVLSAALDYVPFPTSHPRASFCFMFGKDLLATLLTTGAIIATQVGIFNRCSMYTYWGRVGLMLPEVRALSGVLVHGIHTVYPAIAFLCIGLNLLVVPGLVLWRYKAAIRVFMQRDDEKSNLHGLHTLYRGLRRMGRPIERTMLSPIRRVFVGVTARRRNSQPPEGLLEPRKQRRSYSRDSRDSGVVVHVENIGMQAPRCTSEAEETIATIQCV